MTTATRPSATPTPPEKTVTRLQERPAPAGREFFADSPVSAAKKLAGALLLWDGTLSIIAETEAYSARGDAACHTARSPKSRAFLDASPPGTCYVYLNYGMHWMLNFVVKSRGVSGFVLIRALLPLAGTELMLRRRGREPLCSTPGRLTQALAITGRDHGCDICATAGRGVMPRPAPVALVSGPRIGISAARELPWRFVLRDPDRAQRNIREALA